METMANPDRNRFVDGSFYRAEEGLRYGRVTSKCNLGRLEPPHSLLAVGRRFELRCKGFLRGRPIHLPRAPPGRMQGRLSPSPEEGLQRSQLNPVGIQSSSLRNLLKVLQEGPNIPILKGLWPRDLHPYPGNGTRSKEEGLRYGRVTSKCNLGRLEPPHSLLAVGRRFELRCKGFLRGRPIHLPRAPPGRMQGRLSPSPEEGLQRSQLNPVGIQSSSLRNLLKVLQEGPNIPILKGLWPRDLHPYPGNGTKSKEEGLRCGTIEQGSKTLICISFTKLNIHLLLERVFLNFSEYSLTVTQMQANAAKSLHKFRNRSHFSRDAKRIYEKTCYSSVVSTVTPVVDVRFVELSNLLTNVRSPYDEISPMRG
ncbi:hypothetical protein CSKR_110254 [Clonorchis sinensis]|uniref:Uncharacterized protein n=1 Tax=Clonorchis sinensis TaxID=79923 RepID=A0A3R7JPL9_CLOSI|nr:hypothetical protein CSKR_110254 [Clonorchis sinensis]